jgi:hypothetical protein
MNSFNNLNFEEYGNPINPTIMLLHGTLLSVRGYDEVVKKLEDHYHLIVPYLDGHANALKGFTSINDLADHMFDFIVNYLDGKVEMICGMGIGGQCILEMLSMDEDFCDYALVESTRCEKAKAYKRGNAHVMRVLTGNKWCAKAYYLNKHYPKAYFDAWYEDMKKITDEDMKKILEAESSYTVKKMITHTKAKVMIEVGSREGALIKQAEDLHHQIPKSQLLLMYKYHQGDFSMNHVDSYVNLIEKLLHRLTLNK